MEREVKKSVRIEDGKHTGLIEEIQERTEPYNYIDLIIQLSDNPEMKLKVSYPDNLSEMSKLGQALKRLGLSIEPESKVDISQIKGKKVSFQTLEQKGKDGNLYANILPDSLKAAE